VTELLRPLDEGEALHEAGNRGGRALDLVDRFAAAGKLWLCAFGEGDGEEFLGIAWQENDDTRYLTPSSSPRTLRAVGERILEEFGSFGALVRAQVVPGALNPHWFEPCAQIERDGFDWHKWARPWLVPAQGDECRHSTDTRLYVWEGVHSSIVLAVGVLSSSIVWQRIEAIVSLERPPA
jgi:hypothetical protein